MEKFTKPELFDFLCELPKTPDDEEMGEGPNSSIEL